MPDLPGIEEIRFANPEWLQALWGLPLLLLLYLLRRRVGRYLAPHLPLWERVFEEHRRRRPSTFRTLLSLLLQATIFGGAILLVAAPYQERGAPGRGHTVIVLDRSLGTRALGTDGRPLAVSVLERGRTLIETAARDGTVAVAILAGGLVPASGTWSGSGAAGLPADPGATGGARPVGLVADLALRLAPSGACRVVFVTPFRPSPEGDRALLAASVTLASAGSPAPNAGIRAVSRLPDGGLRVRIAGEGEARILRLQDTDGRSLVEVPVQPVPEGLERDLDVPARAGPAPRLELVPGDAFPADDRADLVLPERSRLRVLVAADGETPWLDAWLGASDLVDVEGSGRVTLDELAQATAGFDVVVLVGEATRGELPARPALLLGWLGSGLPIRQTEGPPGPAEPVRIARDDPLVRGLDLSDWRITRMVPLSASEGAEVVVEGSLGPLISRGRQRGTPFVAVAVPPDPALSTLPLLAAFPLLLEAALRELAGPADPEGPPVLQAGARFELLPAEESVLLSAEGGSLPVEPLPDGTGFQAPERPGRYVTVAPESRELAVALLSHPGLPGPAFEAGGELPAFPASQEREPLDWLLAFALLVLIGLEWWLWQLALVD